MSSAAGLCFNGCGRPSSYYRFHPQMSPPNCVHVRPELLTGIWCWYCRYSIRLIVVEPAEDCVDSRARTGTPAYLHVLGPRFPLRGCTTRQPPAKIQIVDPGAVHLSCTPREQTKTEIRCMWLRWISPRHRNEMISRVCFHQGRLTEYSGIP